MKTPTNASNVAGRLTQVPRAARLAIALVLVSGVGYALFAPMFSDGGGNGSIVSAEFQKFSDDLARTLGAAFAPYHQALDDLAANPEVATALSSGTDETRAALAGKLMPPLDGVLALRLLPADYREPAPAAKPPITYASISMLNRSREEGKDVPVEAHLAGTPDEHLVMLKRVEAAGADGKPALLGFLHLSLKLDFLRKSLGDNPPQRSYVEIRQVPGNAVAASGVKPTGDVPTTNSHIPDSRFVVTVMSAGLLPAQAGDTGHGMLLAVLALALACGGAIAMLLSRRRRGVTPSAHGATESSVIFQGAIKAILEGAHPGLEQLLPGVRVSLASAGTSALDAALGARAEAEDVTRIKGTPRAASSEDPTVPRASPTALNVDFNLDGDPPEAPAGAEARIDRSIFRSYDIRGIVGQTLTEDSVHQIGRALGAEAEACGQKTVVVARDGRHSSEPLMQALSEGLLESGRDVLDIGLAPTPVLYFATHYLDAHSGVMITGSHNPAEYNGLKIVLDGQTLSGEAIQSIRRRVDSHDFVEGTGSMQSTDIIAEYIRRISEEIPVSLGDALKVVVDCGNAVPGMVAPAILRAIGHDVIELFCDVDGNFPNHHPDPSQPENLQQLIATVLEEGADLGLAFDGDGDRLGVVDGEGNIIWPDRQLILFARDVLARNPGAKIIYDVKCSRHLPAEITAAGGEPILSKTGHSLIKTLMQDTGALLAGELSGHIFFKDRWYGFDDALYAAARLLEILVNSGKSPAEVFAELPGGVATHELRLQMPEARHAEFMAQVIAAADEFEYAELNTLDGLRADFVDSWGLIRPSNTTPCLVLRFEGDDADSLAEVQGRFRKLLKGIDSSLTLPF